MKNNGAFFSNLNKIAIDSTVLLTLAGHAPSVELLQWRAEEAELSVAVDGGWLAHRHAGMEPDVILGDFDSCGDLSEIEKVFPRSALHHLSCLLYTSPSPRD